MVLADVISDTAFVVIVSAVLVPKLVQEYFMHVAFIRIWDVVPVHGVLGHAAQWSLYFLPPAAALLWRLKWARPGARHGANAR